MSRYFEAIFRVTSAWNANQLIYYLNRIPLIKKIFTPKLLRHGETKARLNMVAMILKFLFGFAKKALYYFVLFILLGEDVEFLQVFLFMNIFLGAWMNHPLKPQATSVNYVLTEYLNIPGKPYYFYRMLTEYVPFFIQHGIILAIFSRTGERIPPFSLVLTALVAAIGIRLLVDYVEYRRFLRKGDMSHSWWQHLIVYGICIIGAYLPAISMKIMGQSYGHLPWINALFHPATILLYIVLGVVMVTLLNKQEGYRKLQKHEASYLGQMQESKDMQKETGGFKEKDYRLETWPGTEKKRGYDYLHSLFFQRHWKQFGKSFRIRASIVGVATLAILAVILFVPEEGIKIKILDILQLKKASWFFILYLLSYKEDYSRALFMHMDRWMLSYPFYRRRKDILQCFLIRIKQSYILNLGLTLLIILGLTVVFAAAGQIRSVLPLALLLLILSFFFSTHYVALYYLVQPYTAQMDMKSPLYGILNALVYLIL